jgi:hypothetical protein
MDSMLRKLKEVKATVQQLDKKIQHDTKIQQVRCAPRSLAAYNSTTLILLLLEMQASFLEIVLVAIDITMNKSHMSRQ